MRFVRLALAVPLALLVLLLACTEDLSTNVKPPNRILRNVLYVAPGGTGSGSDESPLGSIQAAIDSVAANGSYKTLMVAAGEYPEYLVIRAPIAIRGGLNPAADWQPHASDSSVLTGGTEIGQGVGIVIDHVSGLVELQDLHINAASANAPGAGSYGVCCWSSSDVRLVRCVVRAGSGQPGADGSPGTDGTSGDTGANPAPGSRWAPGGRGADAERAEPEQGFCADGSQTGGEPGEDGGGGNPGANGVGGPAAVSWLASGGTWLASAAGSAGDTGSIGCGGGGGRAGYAITPSGVQIIPGGGGGGGGSGGSAGTGGHGGGSSVGLVLYQSTCHCEAVSIFAGIGGRGGAGGQGGAGGEGGAGGPRQRIGLARSSPGGDGGPGGIGGHGGGGAGGWSIAIALSSGSTLAGESPAITIGNPGSGGSSSGRSGEDGHAVARQTVAD